MKARVLVVLVVVLALVAAACGRSDSSSESGGETTTTKAASTASGDFGSLKDVCGPGDAKGATSQGVTDTDIRVGTISDPGFAGRQGLNQEFFDVAKVFTDWCNAAGGINGRKLKVDLLDAKVTEYRSQILTACGQDFALVGGGGVLDDAGESDRLKCLLPSVPGFVVSAPARDSELVVQPLPNVLNQLPVGNYQWLAKEFPDAVKKVATLTGNYGSTALVEKQAVEGAEASGYTIIYRGQYNVLGESSWTPIAQKLQDVGAKALLWTGEPENLAKLEVALKDINYSLDFIRADANHYDKLLIDSAGNSIQPTYINSAVNPFEMASEVPAVQQYIDLFKQYMPNGKWRSYLGLQGFSAWLLFAKAAGACGSDLTRKCLLDEARQQGGTKWDGGGLHAPANVSQQQPSQCYVVLKATTKGFTVQDVDPNNGIFNCAASNVYDLKGDYGKGPRLSDFGLSINDLK